MYYKQEWNRHNIVFVPAILNASQMTMLSVYSRMSRRCVVGDGEIAAERKPNTTDMHNHKWEGRGKGSKTHTGERARAQTYVICNFWTVKLKVKHSTRVSMTTVNVPPN